MTTYLGFTVLEAPPDAREEVSDTMPRSMNAFDPGPGKQWATARDACPAMERSYLWTCQTRAQIVSLKAFLTARKGRAIPFWVPTWRRDLVLVNDVGASDAGLSIQAMRYTDLMFPSPARRHLAFITSGTPTAYRKVTASVASGSAEALTLSSPLGSSFAKDQLVSFLVLARLVSDDLEITYRTDSVAECRIPYVEIPQEAP